MFQTVPASFNSYMCGKCFRQDVNGSGLCGGFNSYMCRECFSGAQVSNLYERLFRFIYAWGMFRPQAMLRLPLELFQFIYVRGMFQRST